MKYWVNQIIKIITSSGLENSNLKLSEFVNMFEVEVLNFVNKLKIKNPFFYKDQKCYKINRVGIKCQKRMLRGPKQYIHKSPWTICGKRI